MLLLHKLGSKEVEQVTAAVCNQFLRDVTGFDPVPMLTDSDLVAWSCAPYPEHSTCQFTNISPLFIIL